ncbi:MAG: hypothetical protein R3242_11490, partial [Akkermansiaceae bacterium]|nr:hypothetical protein [Akkermansiaceae bacterium]
MAVNGRRSTLAPRPKKRHGVGVEQSPDSKPGREWPWQAGLRSARANFLPALVVQAAMVALLIAYYQHPPTREALDQLADFKQRTGYLFICGSAMLAAGIIPELLRIFFFQKGRIRKRNLSNLLFTLPFWAFMAITVDLFYKLQDRVFGDAVDLQTVAIKVAVDQFVYAALFASPVTCILYEWKLKGYRISRMPRVFSLRYYRDVVFPVLFANWCVWIPMICVVYCLPLPLQFPLFSLALS